MTTRHPLLPLLVILALLLAAAPVHAEDDPPPFGASDLAIEEEGLKDGWEISYDDLEGTPGEELETWVMQVATTSGLEEDDLLAETRILQGPDGAVATLLVLEVDGDPKGLESALATRGKGLGYSISTLAHPSRILVVSAPDAWRGKLEAMQREYAVRILTHLGYERLENGSLGGAAAFGKGGRAIDPKAGAPVVLLGMVLTKEDKWVEAVEAFQAGFKKSATVKPEGRFAMRGYAHYGYACLQVKKPEYDKLGRDAFAECVALESFGTKKDPKFIQRYNYACALARLGQKGEALDQLELAFTYRTKRSGKTGTKRWIESAVVPDEDLKNLLGDERFKALIKRFTGGAGVTSGLEGL